MRQAFHGSNNQASHRKACVQRIPGKAGIATWRGERKPDERTSGVRHSIGPAAPRASSFWMQLTGEMKGLGFARQPQPILIEAKLSSATKNRCSRTKDG
jgi:hypothetical protein